jgi:hypothetical protein
MYIGRSEKIAVRNLGRLLTQPVIFYRSALSLLPNPRTVSFQIPLPVDEHYPNGASVRKPAVSVGIGPVNKLRATAKGVIPLKRHMCEIRRIDFVREEATYNEDEGNDERNNAFGFHTA